MPDILFVCTANQFRSPIAAAYFAYKIKLMGLENGWSVNSAGTWTSKGLPAHPKAIKAAARIGLDLRTHQTREVSPDLLDSSDLIVVMQHNHKEALEAEFPSTRGRIYLLGSLANLPDVEIADPADKNFARADYAVRLLHQCIDKAFLKLVQFGTNRCS